MNQSPNQRSILVTGAGGFIGGWVAETLCLDRRWHVRGGVRRWSSAARIARFPVEVSLCDVLSCQSLEKAMDGVTDVVHCATGDAATIVNGTRNILETALKRNIRVIHLSSIAVYGNATGVVSEGNNFATSGSEYAMAKVETEHLCKDFSSRGLRVVVLRPTIVYGPFSTLWTTNIALRLLTGRWGNLGPAGDGTCNLVYVLDLVNAVRCALESGRGDGQVFNINGPESLTWNDYFKHFNARLGLPALRNFSPALARWKSRLLYPARCVGKYMLNNHREFLIAAANRSRRLKAALKSTEATMRATATSDQLELYALKAQYPSDNAARTLGYSPSYGIQSGIDLSCTWLKHAGIV